MSWSYNSNNKYIKKYGKFKKSYSPSYNQHLYNHVQTDIFTHLKFVKNQHTNYSNFNKPSLSTLLTIIWLSQQSQYRRMYYTWCCLLTRFTTVYYKPYIEYLQSYSTENKLSIFTQQNAMFKSLESYYYITPHFQTFKSDYFFYDNYDYPYLLPYSNYVFKNDFAIYGVLWTGVERLRQKKYNEYVKSHYILHQPKYVALRARHIVKNFLYPKNQLLNAPAHFHKWQLNLYYKFFMSAKTRKYQILLHSFQAAANAYPRAAIYKFNKELLLSYYQTTQNYINTYIWNSVEDYQKLNSRWFRSLIYVPIVWGLNKAFVDYIYQFPTQSRLDVLYGSDYIIAHGAGYEVYDRLMEKQMLSVKQQAIGQFVIQDAIQDYFIINNLSKCVSKTITHTVLINKLHPYLFDTHAVDLMITHDVFNRYLLTRLFTNQVRVSPLKIRSQVQVIDNAYVFQHIQNYIVCGYYYKTPKYISTLMGIMSYFYWRSYNTDGIHQAHKGRLHLHHYMQKLNIQNLLSQQLYNVYNIILYIWNINKIGVSTLALKETWNFISINYINWLQEYSYLNFFCLFKNSHISVANSYYQQLYINVPYMSLLSHVAIRRYLHHYSTVLKRLRRAPFDQGRGTCIHGKNPDRLQQWLVHVNWMRIIGLTRDQLPFYLYPNTDPNNKDNQENTDYLQELIKKTSHHHIDIYSCNLFVIENSANTNSNITLKPYIKFTNMLYK